MSSSSNRKFWTGFLPALIIYATLACLAGGCGIKTSPPGRDTGLVTDHPDSLVRHAQAALDTGNHSEALALLTRAVDTDPSHRPALESLAGEVVTLIVGGFERGLDWAGYGKAFKKARLQAVIGVPDNGPRVVESLRAAGVRPQAGLHEAPDLETAVSMARRMTTYGAVVLLSPGAPSFPHFRDYRDRGRRFGEWCGFRLEERDLF